MSPGMSPSLELSTGLNLGLSPIPELSPSPSPSLGYTYSRQNLIFAKLDSILLPDYPVENRFLR